MIESGFIIMLVLGFILFLMALFEDSNIFRRMIFSGISLIVFMILFAQSFYIEIPGSTTTYSELGIQAMCLAFIFINIIVMFLTVLPKVGAYFSNRSQWRG